MWKKIWESEIWEGKRKFSIMLIVLGVGITFRLMDLIDGHDFASMIKDVSISFMGANLVKHIIDTAQDYINVKKSNKP